MEESRQPARCIVESWVMRRLCLEGPVWFVVLMSQLQLLTAGFCWVYVPMPIYLGWAP